VAHRRQRCNASSVLGIVTAGWPQAAYAASKAGLLGLTRDLAAQWTSRKGIRVNAVAPGFFASEMTAHRLPPVAGGQLVGCRREATDVGVQARIVKQRVVPYRGPAAGAGAARTGAPAVPLLRCAPHRLDRRPGHE